MLGAVVTIMLLRISEIVGIIPITMTIMILTF